jgi:hypothetical protein
MYVNMVCDSPEVPGGEVLLNRIVAASTETDKSSHDGYMGLSRWPRAKAPGHIHLCPDCEQPQPCQPKIAPRTFWQGGRKTYTTCWLFPMDRYYCPAHRRKHKVAIINRIA